MRIEKDTVKLEELLNKRLKKLDEPFRVKIITYKIDYETVQKIRFIFLNEEIQNRLDKLKEMRSEIHDIIKESRKISTLRYAHNFIYQKFILTYENINEFNLDTSYKSIYSIGDKSIASYVQFINFLIILKKIFLKYIGIENIDSPNMDILDIKIEQVEKILKSYKKDLKLFRLIYSEPNSNFKFREFLKKNNIWISYRYREVKYISEGNIVFREFFKIKKTKFVGLTYLLHENYQKIIQSKEVKRFLNEPERIILNNDNKVEKYFTSYLLAGPSANFKSVKKIEKFIPYKIRDYIKSIRDNNKEIIFLKNYLKYDSSSSSEKEKLYKKTVNSFNKLFDGNDKQSMKLLGKIK